MGEADSGAFLRLHGARTGVEFWVRKSAIQWVERTKRKKQDCTDLWGPGIGHAFVSEDADWIVQQCSLGLGE